MTCVARYAQRWGAHIAVVPIAPWQGFINTRRGTIQVCRKREGSEAGAVSVCKSSSFQKFFGHIFFDLNRMVICAISMGTMVEEWMVYSG